MSALATIRTDQLVHPDKLAGWREAMSLHLGRTPDHVRSIEKTRFVPIDDRPLNGRLEYGSLGNLHFCRMSCSAHRFSRELEGTSAPSGLPWLLVLQMTEVSHFEQAGSRNTLAAGEMLLLDCSRPFNVTSPRGCDYLMLLCHGLDRTLMDTREPRLDTRTGLASMVRNLITGAYTHYSQLNETSSFSLGKSIEALLINAMEQQQQATRIARDTHYYRRLRISAFIEDHLAERNLTPKQIAEAVQCSVRTLHRIFESLDGIRLTEYIWQRRLARCAQALRDSSSAERSITEIAYDWGFTSSSHFSTAFKAAYGLSPRRFREVAALSG
ncbi:helix-turn-helix domain-containing protein [Pseudomonas sp. RIT411]|uniref:helix-turn-helix domain-containing protein n=1 Tax=Pseudomonas sp. RIT411 TaxID=2202160 RepID=UPI000D3D4C2C|nr:helix-turn-helix domain-containing protein [Pseudomonas sp. RIT 411]RAU33385.1 helix-turn-helix domain-containing protein [Pseudomonas sp. RIT 411]